MQISALHGKCALQTRTSRCPSRHRPELSTSCRNEQRRKVYAQAAAEAPPQTTFILHVDQTSISFPLRPDSGKQLNDALQALLHTFAAKQKAERPQRWKSMEFRLKGEIGQPELEFLEVFCNPNAASTAFDAKALITLKTRDGLKLTTEGRLSALKEDLDAFIQQHC